MCFQSKGGPWRPVPAAAAVQDGLGARQTRAAQVGRVGKQDLLALGTGSYHHPAEVLQVLPIFRPQPDPDLHLPLG